MVKFVVDTSDFKRLHRDLEKFAKRAVPHAMRNALNDTAFEARKLWQAEVRRSFTLRNQWTERSIVVEKARGTNMTSMQSRVGSRATYMGTQEFGGKDTGAVPTSVSSGEGRGKPPRKKLVRQANKMAKIALGQRYRRGTRKQRNAVSFAIAARTGNPFIFLELPKRKGLFVLRGGKRAPRVDMVWNVTKRSHRVPATPTLQPALAKLERQVPRILTRALLDQLKRHRVFGY